MLRETLNKTKSHPCYNQFAGEYARIHLPVAPECNISCKYCNRKYDCLNESRPGVTGEILTPEQAAAKFKRVKKRIANLTVVGFAGPGDALANYERVKKTVQLIREQSPEITFCLSTNGLRLPEFAASIADEGISHLTVTINAVNPEIGAEIYDYIRLEGQEYHGIRAARLLLERQLKGLKMVADRGIVCKVNIITLRGINDEHIGEIVERVKKAGAYMVNIMPLVPVEGTEFVDLEPLSSEEINRLRQKYSDHIRQMYHCRQCRSDSAGCLGEDRSFEFAYNLPGEEPEEYLFAAASSSGKIIDQHFGHVDSFYIYRYSEGDIEFLEERPIERYCTDKSCDDKEAKMEGIVNLLSDCAAVLTVRIGTRPRIMLEKEGIPAFMVFDTVRKGIKYAVERIENGKKGVKNR